MTKTNAMRLLSLVCVLGAAACSENFNPGEDAGPADTSPSHDRWAGGDLTFADRGTSDDDPTSCAHAEAERTYVGCDFWPTVHPNVVKTWFDYAVVVANAGNAAGQVVVERGGKQVATAEVPANGLVKVFLPWVDALKHFTAKCDTDISVSIPPLDSRRVVGGAYHLTSTVPVTVWQFNPLEYAGKGGPPGKSWEGCDDCWPGCHSYTNDASLLLPSTALTGSYVVSAQAGIDTEEIRSPGYILVTGLHDGTKVTVKVSAVGKIAAGAGIAETGPGEVLAFSIDQGDVVRLLGTPATDLGGTLVTADQAVQVMTGVPHIYLPFDRGSSDHIEEVVFPVETLGKRYYVTRPTGPRGGPVKHSVRLYGVTDGTRLTYPGHRPADAPNAIARGQVHDLGIVEEDFEVIADQPLQIATFMLGQTMVDPAIGGKGDPSQSAVAAVEQYRRKYVFLAPDDYDVSYADVVMPGGARVLMDGKPIEVTPTKISSDHGVARIRLGPGIDGAHLLESDQPVGLQVAGYGFATSYHYPGGLNLKGIAPPLPRVK